MDITTEIIHYERSDAIQLCISGIKNNDIHSVKLGLKQKEVNVNYVDQYGQSLLYLACLHRNEAIIAQFLKQENIDVTICPIDNRITPLHIACQNNLKQSAQLICKKNHDALYMRNSEGNTPFHFASHNQHIECIKLLFSADNTIIDIQNNDGNTALHYLHDYEEPNLMKKQLKIIKFLINKKSDPTIQNKLQATPLLYMFYLFIKNNALNKFIKKNPAITKTLIQTKDAQNNNQLHLCAKIHIIWDKNFPQYLSFLMDHGLNIQSRNNSGKRPVDNACEEYNRLYNQHKMENSELTKTNVINQEQIMHTFLLFAAQRTRYVLFKEIMNLESLKDQQLPKELVTYILQIYYVLNIETVIAKRYQHFYPCYDDFIGDKNTTIQLLLDNPNPRLLMGSISIKNTTIT